MEFDETLHYASILTRPRLELLGISLRQSVAELSPYTHIRIRNLFNYFENELMEFDNDLHMH